MQFFKYFERLRKPVVYLFLILAFAGAAASLLLLRGEVEEHTVAAYDSEKYTDLEHLNRLLVEAGEKCKTEKNEEHDPACKIAIERIMNHASLHDLAAQETVALATRGLLRVGAYQAFASFATLAFLIWTVFLTRDMRREAVASAKSMSDTLHIAQSSERAHVFGMAYAKFEDIKGANQDRPPHVHHADVDNGHFTYWATVENVGQTPARNVKYSFVRDYGSKDDAYLSESREIGSLGPGEVRKIFSYTDDTTGYVKITELDRPRDLKIRVSVTYTDVFGVKQGPTISNCQLKFGVEAHGTFRILTKEEVLRATSDPSNSVAGALHWKLHDLRDVWMRVRQTTKEERDAKNKKKSAKK